MPKNKKEYQREYMRRAREVGKVPTNWRLAKKEKSVWYRICTKFFKMSFKISKQIRGRSMSKTLTLGLALGPIFIKTGYSPSLSKTTFKSKMRLLF